MLFFITHAVYFIGAVALGYWIKHRVAAKALKKLEKFASKYK